MGIRGNTKPFRRGKFADIVQPRKKAVKPRFTRVKVGSNKETIDLLVIALVAVLSKHGIELRNIRAIVKDLVKLGWSLVKKSSN